MKKKILAMLPVLGGVASVFAEGTAPSAATTPGEIANIFTPWVSNTATAMVTLITAGAVIVGVMYVFRVLKRVFNGSK